MNTSKPILHRDVDLLSSPHHTTWVLVLNNGLSYELISQLWPLGEKRIAADGAANVLFDEGISLLPDAVHGDLDSLRPEVAAHYGQKGVSVSADKDQEIENDMGKCLTLMSKWPNAKNANILVLGVFGGRFDHEMANLDAALKHSNDFNRILLLGEENSAEVITTGSHLITLAKHQGPTCGLIPVFGRCDKVSTNGLKWDLNMRALQFGELCSTSNHVLKDEVEINTSQPLLWTCIFKLPSTSSNNALLKPVNFVIPLSSPATNELSTTTATTTPPSKGQAVRKLFEAASPEVVPNIKMSSPNQTRPRKDSSDLLLQPSTTPLISASKFPSLKPASAASSSSVNEMLLPPRGPVPGLKPGSDVIQPLSPVFVIKPSPASSASQSQDVVTNGENGHHHHHQKKRSSDNNKKKSDRIFTKPEVESDQIPSLTGSSSRRQVASSSPRNGNQGNKTTTTTSNRSSSTDSKPLEKSNGRLKKESSDDISNGNESDPQPPRIYIKSVPQPPRIYIKSVPKESSLEEIKDCFKLIGRVDKVGVRNKSSGDKFAFVTLSDGTDVDEFIYRCRIAALSLGGTALEVERTKPRR